MSNVPILLGTFSRQSLSVNKACDVGQRCFGSGTTVQEDELGIFS